MLISWNTKSHFQHVAVNYPSLLHSWLRRNSQRTKLCLLLYWRDMSTLWTQKMMWYMLGRQPGSARYTQTRVDVPRSWRSLQIAHGAQERHGNSIFCEITLATWYFTTPQFACGNARRVLYLQLLLFVVLSPRSRSIGVNCCPYSLHSNAEFCR